MNIYVVGGAGAGKTTLSRRLSSLLSSPYINLDPATPQAGADYDVRDLVRTEDLMVREGLGINGAMLRSMEIIGDCAKKVAHAICVSGDVRIIDTPGQLEVFLYGDAALRLMEETRVYGPNVLVHVIDGTTACTFEGFVAAFSLALFVELRLEAPGVVLFNKVDLLSREEKSYLLKLCDPQGFGEEAERRGDFTGEFALRLRDFISYLSLSTRPLLASARTGEGLDELIDLLHEVQCSCGDLS